MPVEHHDLVHEFPELKDRIHELKLGNAHFRSLLRSTTNLRAVLKIWKTK